MRLLKKAELLKLIENKELVIESSLSSENLFLDELRFGLTIDEIIELKGEVDLQHFTSVETSSVNIDSLIIYPERFYIGITNQKFGLPNNLIGFIYTRSMYARVGIEFVQSSNMIIPGFGMSKSTPIILEIQSNLTTRGFTKNDIYCFVLFFEVDEAIDSNVKIDYTSRFPLD